jgi:hypothetical protein
MENRLEKLEWPIVWGPGSPECTLITSGSIANAIIPSRDGWQWSILSFKNCESAKYGGPNDEVIDAHPLSKLGLDCGNFYKLHDSEWKEGLQKINSTHHCYNSNSWVDLNHYILVLREHVLECLATGFSVKRYEQEFDEVVSFATKKIQIIPSKNYEQ